MKKWLAVLVLAVLSAPLAAAPESNFYGMLRARDLSPFGYLRLDMRPSASAPQEPGSWGIETDFAYQNTWATSPEVEKYLNGLSGRRELGPAEFQAIRDLPGENYLVDIELAQFDATFNYQIDDKWSTYLIVSGASFGGGFLDGFIENFHRVADQPEFGRPAAARNDGNLLFDLKSGQFADFSATGGGLLDPVIGVRYTGAAFSENWNMTIEGAIKIPVSDREAMLSTGRTDVGVQLSVQRYWARQAVYVNASAVYYAGMKNFVPEPSRVLPTLVVGYERRMTPRTNLIFQSYFSRSVYQREQTDLAELRGSKIQLSGGIHHRRGAHLFTFALTENIGNINNTPDVGFQVGWSYHPGWR
jgi:hypothetical protein